ncbi:polysaccharide biosynthesis protein EpsC [Bacillaceae bacterium JMAK1]|nr:polysaccharide biosynthesis protein EpsC [Bacillaceae bacterium JMAK1]
MYRKRIVLLMLIDSLVVISAIFLGAILFYDSSHVDLSLLLTSSIALLISHHIFAYLFKLYKRAWQFVSMIELLEILKAVTFSIIITIIVQFIFFDIVYIRTLIVTWMLHLILIGGVRFAWRMYRDGYIKLKENRKKTLIIGAGTAGTVAAKQLKRSRDSELIPVVFIDDDIKKQQLEILGIPVSGTTNEIHKVVTQYQIEYILIAIPSLKRNELQRIYKLCSETKIRTQIMPMLVDVMSGKVEVTQFRDIQVGDLLGRIPVELDTEGIANTITGKIIVITGAGGSIGSEVCRQVSKFDPAEVILLGHGENSIYNIHMELIQKYSHITYHPVIADVQDRPRIFEVLNKYQPNVVYHAAAHKHVPLMEANSREAIKNNIIGTKNIAEASDSVGVNTFVMISTDKAVNPTSVMGATKRIAEMVIQHLDRHSSTRFVAVRFGNVLGSRGSVIPLFKRQIAEGGPITITHPDMTRYFMTIPEASRLVIQAGALAGNGEIFVLDMGEPVKITDLAKNLIKLSGFNKDDIKIDYIGLRPGEKMFEELLGENEISDKQVFPKIHRGKTIELNIEKVWGVLNNYNQLREDQIREELLKISNNSVDKTNIV